MEKTDLRVASTGVYKTRAEAEKVANMLSKVSRTPKSRLKVVSRYVIVYNK